jgi:hypothetical protein
MMALVANIGGLPWAAIFMVVGMVFLALAAFFSPPPPYGRFSYGWAGMFFVVLAMAIG